MSDSVKERVICVREEMDHSPESVLRNCDRCFNGVWCSPHHLIRTPICLQCAVKIPNINFVMTREDFEGALEELNRRTALN